jgi:D-arabinose 1-dehydrogenase-like Zn-dependent alcohol dehydrogenase
LGGADVALCVAVSPKAFEQAFKSLRRSGTAVFVGASRYLVEADKTKPATGEINIPLLQQKGAN